MGHHYQLFTDKLLMFHLMKVTEGFNRLVFSSTLIAVPLARSPRAFVEPLETAEEVTTDFPANFFQGLGWIPDLPPATSQGYL
jgi:hypothetical protein